MPSHLPSSFASAAAGQSNRDPRAGRDGRGNGSGEWSRRDGRSTNGTMTFRRSSTTPFNNQSTAQPTSASEMPAPVQGVLQAPVAAPVEVVPIDGSFRYTRDQLLSISKAPEVGNVSVEELFIGSWNPAHMNGNSGRNWGKTSENHAPQDPTVCWEVRGQVRPIGLQEMTAEEKELFNSDVNSPVKQPPQNKDGAHGGGALNGRKASISHGSNYGVSSPSSASRPGTRRRETGETNAYPGGTGGLASPTNTGRFSRDDPAPWFGRRSIDDGKEATYDEPEEEPTLVTPRDPVRVAPFSGLARSNTSGAPAGGFAAASSLWGTGAGAQGISGSSAMGSFGNFSMPTSTIGDKRFGASRGESRLAHLIPKESQTPTSEAAPTPKGNETAGGGADAGRSWRPRPRTDTDPFGDEGGNSNLLSRQSTSPPPLPTQGSQRGLSVFETPIKGSAGDYGMAGLSLGTHAEEDSSPQTNPYRSPPAERRDDEAGGGMGGGDAGASHAHGLPPSSEQVASGFGAISRGFPTPAAVEGSDRSQTSSVGGTKGFPPLSTLGGWPSSATPDRERPQFANPFGSALFSPEVQSPSALGAIGKVFSQPGPASSGLNSAGGSLRGSKLGSLFPPAMQAQMQQDVENSQDLRQANPLGAIGRVATTSQPGGTDSPIRTGRAGVFEDLFPTSEASRSQGIYASAGEQLPAGLAALAGPSSQPPQPSSAFSTTATTTAIPTTAGPVTASATSSAPAFGSIPPASSSDAPQSHPRTMVMPDRMRWVYLDPQGQTQGPFTGLEMNDWYKANFFTPDLRVKRIEDDDFEPLGQLIRRIGNSREPFLVPQIGIAHGPPSQAGGPFAGAASGDARGVVPPLVGAFPSFGRTLTAEEQNNLERRKQEEQFMMHRQREMMAQHQQNAFNKMAMQTGMPPVGGVLHHHSSAHSLQSQPSFGSMTSPIGMPPQGPLGGLGGPPSAAVPTSMPSYFEITGGMMPQPGMTTAPSDFMRDDLNPQERQMLASMSAGIMPGLMPSRPGAGVGPATSGPVGPSGSNLGSTPGTVASSTLTAATASSGDAGLRSGLPGVDQLQPDSQGFSARLKEFQELRAGRDAEDAALGHGASGSLRSGAGNESAGYPAMRSPGQQQQIQHEAAQIIEEMKQAAAQETKQKAAAAAAAAVAAAAAAQQQQQASPSLSLTQQVQKTQAAAAKQAQPGLPMPFPPPPASMGTPIAAPTAQRTRSTLPEQYATSRSQSGTPESLSASQTAPPPLAPWAREPGESQKGPNFKEIQEAEAKKAQRAELAAAAARRAAVEQEVAAVREREKATGAGVAAILPTSSTWGSGSPVTATGASSPWAKPTIASTKGGSVAALGGTNASFVSSSGAVATAVTEKKKTLADIQREEESRKQRLAKAQEQSAAASAATALGGGVGGASMGKRYADLAGKGGSGPGLGLGPIPVAGTGPAVGSGWATVGHGGKVKAPTGPAAAQGQGQQQLRTASIGGGGGSLKSPAAGGAAAKTAAGAAAARPGVLPVQSKADAVTVATDEFKKWVRRELERGITHGIDIDSYISTLFILPLDTQLISEAVYANSTTMDGRHFAEEFVRRKKLADKGVVEKTPAGAKGASGGGLVLGGMSSSSGGGGGGAGGADNKGWSEVAKKGSGGNNNNNGGNGNGGSDGGAIQGAGFKVVPGRKRGKK